MSRDRPRRSRRLSEKLLLTAIGIATGIGFTATFVLGYAVWRLDQVERFEVHDVLSAPKPKPMTASELLNLNLAGTKNDKQSTSGERVEIILPPTIDEPLVDTEPDGENYLLVGSDSVEGIAADDAIMSGRSASIANHLADTIMVLRLRQDGTAAVVSVPRDLLVSIASTDTTAKINSAYNLDSSPQTRAARLIETVETHFDIGLQHFVEVDLDGFRRIVDAVGGVSMCFNRPTRDRTIQDSGDPTQGGTGFTADKGWTHLDGDTALAFVRSRRLLTQQPDGQWERLGVWNDLERNSRQQKFIFEALDQALGRAVSNPRTLQRLLDIVATDFRTSNTLSVFDDGLELARRFRGLNVDSDLERYALQLIDVSIDDKAGLEIVDSEHNKRVVDIFRGLRWDDVTEERVQVAVQGPAALSLASRLRGARFKATHQETDAYPENRIRYGIGGDQAAVLLAARLRENVEMVADPSLAGGRVTLELGSQPPSVMRGYKAIEPPTPLAANTTQKSPPPPRTLGVCG
ncbi:MAG TPA: hypothetical protein DCX77_05040 [Acidimicrobiaceae bacterium]|nr:hypothetical protein [Acidimicrobiaceae bacterium]